MRVTSTFALITLFPLTGSCWLKSDFSSFTSHWKSFCARTESWQMEKKQKQTDSQIIIFFSLLAGIKFLMLDWNQRNGTLIPHYNNKWHFCTPVNFVCRQKNGVTGRWKRPLMRCQWPDFSSSSLEETVLTGCLLKCNFWAHTPKMCPYNYHSEFSINWSFNEHKSGWINLTYKNDLQSGAGCWIDTDCPDVKVKMEEIIQTPYSKHTLSLTHTYIFSIYLSGTAVSFFSFFTPLASPNTNS